MSNLHKVSVLLLLVLCDIAMCAQNSMVGAPGNSSNSEHKKCEKGKHDQWSHDQKSYNFPHGHRPKAGCIIVTGLVVLVVLTVLFACIVKCKKRRRQRLLNMQQLAQQSLMRPQYPMYNQNIIPQQGVPIANVNGGQPQFFAIPADQYYQFQQFLAQQQNNYQTAQPAYQQTQQSFQQGQPTCQSFEIQQPNIPAQSRSRYPFIQEQH